jgi:dipeptidyl aminopeptidase/acylaminoacyl peptidase
MSKKISLVAFLLLSVKLVAQAQGPVPPRSLTPSDLFKLEEIEGVTLSPDGENVAYEQRRPLSVARKYQYATFDGHERADVWLAAVRGGRPVNLTHGASDESGFFEPTWSADGACIAMLSTRGSEDGNVRLWVWEKASGKLTKLTDRAVRSFTWIDGHRLAAVLLPAGVWPPYSDEARNAETFFMREWPKAWAGREATASVLDSGMPTASKVRPQQDVMLIDLTTPAQLLASGDVTELLASPDGQYVAFVNQVDIVRPDPAKVLPMVDRLGIRSARSQVVIANTSAHSLAPTPSIAKFIVPGSFRWSRVGHGFAFLGVGTGDDDGVVRLFLGSAGSTRAEVVSLADVDPRAIVWVDGDRVLVYGEHQPPTVSGERRKRSDWWLVESSVTPRNLTEALKTPPENLTAVASGVIGIADGEVLRLDVASGKWTNLTATFDPKVSGISFSNLHGFPVVAAFPPGTVGTRIILETMADRTSESEVVAGYYKLDLVSGMVTSLERPSAHALLAAYSPVTDAALFSCADRSGTFLTLIKGAQSQLLTTLNTFLRDFAEGSLRRIDYLSVDGQELVGWIVLPADYRAGMRSPLVTWVYGGRVYSDKEIRRTISDDSFLNAQLLAARGYAVLFASMPLASVPDGKTQLGSDPYMELMKGVLPAVDKAIEIGIADPKRLAVMGHSYGGYSTYGLITQTNRFKAAIALAGYSDLISFYGSFDRLRRSLPNAHEMGLAPYWAETSQMRMGNPPWKDWGRFLRNSPLFYVDRVQTPLLILQGDLDYVGIEQGEGFFYALFRQNKRARFVRYWGESHKLHSPANIKEAWSEIYAWLDEFCDVSRDVAGKLIFDGDHVKSRNGAPALKPEDFARFDEMFRGSVVIK